MYGAELPLPASDEHDYSVVTVIGAVLSIVLGSRALYLYAATRWRLRQHLEALDFEIAASLTRLDSNTTGINVSRSSVDLPMIATPDHSSTNDPLSKDDEDDSHNQDDLNRRNAAANEHLIEKRAFLNSFANGLNALMLTNVGIRLVLAVVLLSASLTLLSREGDASYLLCPLEGTGLGGVLHRESRLSCMLTATLDQYLFASAYTTTIVFLINLRFDHPMPAWLALIIINAVGMGSTITIWAVLPKRQDGLRFVRYIVTCGIPVVADCSADNAGNHCDTVIPIVQALCDYAFIPICGLLGVSVLRLYLSRTTKVQHSKLRSAIKRRLLPYMVLLLTNMIFDLIARLIPVSKKDDGREEIHALLMACGFLYAASAGLLSVIWAYGEGCLRALLLPHRHNMFSLPDYSTIAFSRVPGGFAAQVRAEEIDRRRRALSQRNRAPTAFSNSRLWVAQDEAPTSQEDPTRDPEEDDVYSDDGACAAGDSYRLMRENEGTADDRKQSVFRSSSHLSPR